MKSIRVILDDFIGLWRICGASIAMKWISKIILNFSEILKRKDLQPADRAMGSGPFTVKYCKEEVAFKIEGPQAISGIREMYVRDTYLHGGLLHISNGFTVVDLGANMGNFTNLALAHGNDIRVVAIEPNACSNTTFERSVGLNKDFLERTTLIRAFVGTESKKQSELIKLDRNYSGALWLSEEELISSAKLTKVDFLKCDIEGGEFGLLGVNSKLLAITRFLAIEIHAFAGDVNSFIVGLQSEGFSILTIKWDPDGSCTALAKKI